MKMSSFIKILSFLFTFFIEFVSFSQSDNSARINSLEDPRVNPEFVKLLNKFMDSAKTQGFRPVIFESFRTKQRALKLAAENKKRGNPTATVSVHSFGMAVDIRLLNSKGVAISFDAADFKKDPVNNFSFNTWMKFIKIGESFKLINAAKHDDTDHWEYHPNWSKTDWISAKKLAVPIYDKFSHLSELERLQKVWEAAGLTF